LRGSASVETKTINNKSAAARAARRIILLFHPLIRPLARLGFCRNYNNQQQKRGGASRPKENIITLPFNSTACAARLL